MLVGQIPCFASGIKITESVIGDLLHRQSAYACYFAPIESATLSHKIECFAADSRVPVHTGIIIISTVIIR